MHSFCRTLIRGVALAGLVAAWLALAGTASAATQKPAAAKAPAGHGAGRLRRPGHVPGLSRGQGRCR